MAHLIKRGDIAVVIAGAHKGKRGKVLQIVRETNRIIVEGVALAKRHTKARSEKEKGGIIEREAAIHRSNVMLATRFDAKAAKRKPAAKA